HVALHIGGQALYLPWHDIRARAISHYHGERIVLGLRAEALSPAPIDSTENVLRGSIRYIEHHGHESLAYLDIGATAVVIDELRSDAEIEERRAPRRSVVEKVRQLSGRAVALGGRPASGLHVDVADAAAPSSAPPSVFGDGRRHRRPAEFVMRLAPYPTAGPGQNIAVAVRLDEAHFFDGRGNRIDVGWR
ncbi:MAG TPA: ABC transporter ATP-binding protein, partial [Micromonosporaceae bacterium]